MQNAIKHFGTSMAKYDQLTEANCQCHSPMHAKLNHNGLVEGMIASECRRSPLSTRARDGWCLNQATSALHATEQEKHLGGSGLPQGAGEDSASQGALCCCNDGRTVSALRRLGDGPEVKR
jgi:hypothetical protein